MDASDKYCKALELISSILDVLPHTPDNKPVRELIHEFCIEL